MIKMRLMFFYKINQNVFKEIALLWSVSKNIVANKVSFAKIKNVNVLLNIKIVLKLHTLRWSTIFQT